MTTRRLAPRITLALAFLAGLVTFPREASARDWVGVIADDDCRVAVDSEGLLAELYGFQIRSGDDDTTDILADLSNEVGESRTCGAASIVRGTDLLASHRGDAASASEFVFATFSDGRLAVDSSSFEIEHGDLGFVNVHVVAHGIPAEWGVRNALGTAVRVAPVPGGFELRFAPVPEVTGDGETFGEGCSVGGSQPDPNTGLGLIAGYAVYRVPDAGRRPTPADFLAAATDRDLRTGGWIYHVSLEDVDLSTSDPSAADRVPNDLVGAVNPDGVAYTGDDTLVFTNVATDPDGTARSVGTAPDPAGPYWHAVQPVVRSAPGTTIASLDGVRLGLSGTWTVTTTDPTGDGVIDAADLDADGLSEFFSSQADAGFGGHGLTNGFGVGGGPLLSPPVLASRIAVPVTGRIEPPAPRAPAPTRW